MLFLFGYYLFSAQRTTQLGSAFDRSLGEYAPNSKANSLACDFLRYAKPGSFGEVFSLRSGRGFQIPIKVLEAGSVKMALRVKRLQQ